MAGWALEFGTVQVGDYTYGGVKLPVPVVKDLEGSILDKGVHYTYDETYAYKNATCLEADKVSISNALAAGKTFYIKITGIGAYEGKTAAPSFTVQKKAVTITVTANLHRAYGATTEPEIGDTEWSVDTNTPLAWSEEKSVLLKSGKTTLGYTYVGKGDATKPGGEYAITYQDYDNSKNYEITVPTNHVFTIDGEDISAATVTVKEGTAFADLVYKGAAFTAADLTGLKLVYGTKELVQGTDFTVSLNDVYNFTSYSAETDGVEYGTGTVEVLSYNASTEVATVKVLTNSVEGFVDKIYTVTGANATSRKQLYEGATASGIWVTVTPNTDAFKSVGTYNYTVNFKGNYAGKKQDFGTFKITKAPLSVEVENIEVTYKAAAYTNDFGTATKTFNWYGLVGEDATNKTAIVATFTAPTVTVTQNGGATNASDEGYALTLTGGSTNTYTNYEIKNYLTTGKLIIKKYEVKLKAKSTTKGPGADDPAFELDTYNLVSGAGHTLSGVTFTRADGDVVGESYDITPVLTNAKVKKGNTDVTSNYDLKVDPTKGQLTIQKSALVITIKDQSKNYGDADPATIAAPVQGTNYIVSGLVAGDEITSLTLAKSWTDASDAGTYLLTGTVEYTGESHYTGVTIVPGNFEIKKAELTVSLPIKTVDAGQTAADALTALTKDGITINGFKKSETVANTYDLSLKDGLTADTDNKLTDQTDAAGYILTLKEAFAKNYTIKGATDAAKKTLAGKLIVGTGAVTEVTLATFADIQTYNQETRPVSINFKNRTRRINATAAYHTWAKDNWNALILPFDITVAELSSKLGFAAAGGYNYAIVNTVKKNSATGKFQFELTTGLIEANTPIMVKTVGDISAADPATDKIINFGSKTIKAPAANSVTVELDNGYKFVGQYANKVLDKTMPMNANDEGLYRFQFGDDDSQFRTFGPNSANSWTIVPFDCYVDLSVDASGREVIFEFEEADGSTTAIKSLTADVNNNVKKEGWYTINGIKLQSAPTQKGVYIFNGKKLVVK